MMLLVTKLISGELGIFLGRMKRLAVLYFVMALFGAMTAGFFIGALYIFLAQRYGPLPTALGFALTFLVLTIIVFILAVIASRPPQKRADDRLKRDIASIASVAAVSNLPVAFNMVKRRKSLLLVPPALAAGYGIWRAVSSSRFRD